MLPAWLVSLVTIAFANALVVLGLVVLWRAGLVSFGQALYYAIGAYAVALTGALARLHRRVRCWSLLGGVAAAGLVAFLVGFLLARYREIFFAMLSLAMSMILYGVLVKIRVAGLDRRLQRATPTFLGYRAARRTRSACALYLAGARRRCRRRRAGRASISARSPARSRRRSATTKSASSSSASR